MKRLITSYFVLVLFLSFSIGISIENHNDCSLCNDEACEINDHKSKETSCCHADEFCPLKNTPSERACECTFETYKIQYDYVIEKKIEWANLICCTIDFIVPQSIGEIDKQEKSKNISYFKLPDKRLLFKLSVYELSSILC